MDKTEHAFYTLRQQLDDYTLEQLIALDSVLTLFSFLDEKHQQMFTMNICIRINEILNTIEEENTKWEKEN